MNKNTVLAFLLIMVSMLFFTSKFYYEKVLRQPYPFDNKQTVIKKDVKKEDLDDSIKKQKQLESSSNQEVISEEYNTILPENSVVDTIKKDTIWIETDKLICGISENGGNIISLKTKEYTYNKKGIASDSYIELIPQEKGNGGANLGINNTNFDKHYFLYKGEQKEINLDKDSVVLEFQTNFENSIVSKKFTFFKNDYKIGYSVVSSLLDGKNVSVGWNCGINESEQSQGKSAQYDQRSIHLYDGKNVDHIQVKKEGKEEQSGYYNWVGITSKYFLIALIPQEIRDADIGIDAFEIDVDSNATKKDKTFNYSMTCKRFANGAEESYWIYAGPSKLTEMKMLKKGLQKVLFKGYAWFFWADKWFPMICEFVLWLLIELQKIVKDYGLVIIILTILLRVVTYPLTQSSMKSMNKMKDIQPKINKIRDRYKSNPQQMNQKIMEFYREEGINPLGGMGGCLPMVLQMPIMISLFIVLRKAIELRGQGTFFIPWVKDLSQAEALFPLGFDIPFYGSNFALMPIIMAVLMYFQNKATIKDPNQKAMIYMMPVMMLVLFNNFPAGLCLYFTFSTGLQVAQQFILEKRKKKTS